MLTFGQVCELDLIFNFQKAYAVSLPVCFPHMVVADTEKYV